MAKVLYAEIYLICLIVAGLLLFWEARSESDSSQDRWLRAMLTAFEVNFAVNFLFAVADCFAIPPSIRGPLYYGLKTAYHLTLCAAVYAWCGYADIQNQERWFSGRRRMLASLLLPAVPMIGAIANLWTHWLFEITEAGEYVRGIQFQWQMGYLAAMSVAFSIPLLRRLPRELEPTRRGHLWLMASFPLCILAGWLFSTLGEQVPVICVCVTIELLCLFVDTSTRQISMDKLTQVNNRQNLLSFLEYKMRYHEESIFLLMIDVDYFKPINDTYGHLEGDEALIQISRVLKKSCVGYRRRPYIGRYGGDEFIIILEGTRQETDALCEAIRSNLREYCAAAKKPYDLTVSIGVGRWHPDMTPQSFIAAADAQLYEIKRARKKENG